MNADLHFTGNLTTLLDALVGHDISVEHVDGERHTVRVVGFDAERLYSADGDALRLADIVTIVL